jgi:DNA polymerase III epsilon subunit-like protein
MLNKEMIQRVLLKYASESIFADMGKPKYLQSPEEILKVFSGKDIIVFDTETTGLLPNVHQITELAAEVVDGDTFEVKDSYHGKARLSDRTNVRRECERVFKERVRQNKMLPKEEQDPSIKDFYGVDQCLALNRHNPNDSENKETNEILIEFYEFCEKYNAIIVGQNAAFDLSMVNTTLKKLKPGATIKNQGVYDTKIFFTTFVIPAITTLKNRGDEEATKVFEAMWDKTKNRPSSKLGVILKAFGVDIKGWHGAMEDVKSTTSAFEKILKFIKENADIVDDPMFKSEQAKNYYKEKVYYPETGKIDRHTKYRSPLYKGDVVK